MLTPEERALITDIKDRLIELHVERDEAAKTGDRDRVLDLQTEIERVAAECQGICHWETQGSAYIAILSTVGLTSSRRRR